MTRHVLLEFMQAVEISINVHGINYTYHILYPTLSSKSVANMISFAIMGLWVEKLWWVGVRLQPINL